METQKVVFINKEQNTRLAGLLRLPEGFDLSKNYPAIVLTGPITGDLPAKALALVQEWLAENKNELQEMWENQSIKKLPPLQ